MIFFRSYFVEEATGFWVCVRFILEVRARERRSKKRSFAVLEVSTISSGAVLVYCPIKPVQMSELSLFRGCGTIR